MQRTDAQWLDDIFETENLTPLFQPIVDAGNQAIFGYEALIRGPSDSPLHSPLTLFDTASRLGRLVDLDLLCRRLAIQRFTRLGLPGRLFLNVLPTTIVERDFREGLTLQYLDQVGLAPERVVIELTEHTPIHDYALMRQAVDHYRRMGFLVALDDLGAGYSGLRHWAELRPDFVKIDRHFINNIDQDPLKRQFLQSILDVSRHLGCQVIAEGIETTGEYRCLWGLNWSFLQGYYFSRPSENPPQAIEHMLPANTPHAGQVAGIAASICRPIEPVEIDTPVLSLAQRFRAQSDLRCVAVVRQRVPVGIIRRHEFLTLFTNPFSHSLYAKRQVEELIEKRWLMARHDTPLEQLSQQITDANDTMQEDVVIVDEQGHYRGMGRLLDLLREITAIQVRSARHANPLTGLPGNVLINDTLAARLNDAQPFVTVYCDLDNFKAYNDTYGYARGDKVIVALSRILQEQIGCRDDFVGHIGGDDFMMVLVSKDWRGICQSILTAFEHLAPSFYDLEHRRAGGIRIENRQGVETFYPLVSLSIAALPVPAGAHYNPLDIAGQLSELKTQAKKWPGNCLFVDRRQP
ncbi:GGDEF domain-containing protein [Litchfieldella qijiaojingensis]|uniref:GGDEF domain-containing protein n=1 Tax=Litchfieldella qijiaojingensis TaxID=980347 RepID=A0ABQ2Z835_9GAMM|nr:bifunctional diguanylate cyclase/phosphodiesterase [Halomonas qijiaojingensis]GGY04801.1 GGDEF domain-containing protein [Halomonas qijiaojingensis]